MDMDNSQAYQNKLILPTLRGKMGDWFYYVALMSFKEVAKRVYTKQQVNTKEKLAEQTQTLVDYLKTQEQRFFNSLILGIYGGHPTWQEINVMGNDNIYEDFPEENLDYLSKTFGILTLNGDENIFVIDGQPETYAIKDALKQDSTNLANN